MRLSAFFSLAAHAGVVLAGLWATGAAPHEPTEATPMIIVPLELVTIGDVTDVMAVTDAEKAEETASAEEAEPTYTASAAKPDEDTVNLDAEPPPPPKAQEAEKKPEATPPPAKAKEEDFSNWLEQTLQDAKKDENKAKPAPAGKTASAETGPPRMGAGEMRRMQMTVTDYIRAQLVNKRCWTDHSDMADAPRLQTTIRVWFGRDGKFARPYQLIEPSRPPAGDLPMQTFIAHAQRALDMCNNLGWQVPEQYFQLQPAPYYIDIKFVPKVGAQ